MSRRPLARALAAGAWACLAPLALAVSTATPAASAAPLPAIPPPPVRWVTDQAGFLSPQAQGALDAELRDYENRTGHHVLVWIGRTVGPLPVEDFTVRAFKAWKVGRKGFDDGLVIFIFADDRKIRFEVGYGLEDKVPDVIAARIIREVMAPRYQAGDRDGMVAAGVEATLAAISGAAAAPGGAVGSSGAERGPGYGPRSDLPRRRPARPLGLGQVILFVILGIAFLILLITHPSFALFLLYNILSGGRGGGGGWGGGGGYSGGGGRSGGGGATGSF